MVNKRWEDIWCLPSEDHARKEGIISFPHPVKSESKQLAQMWWNTTINNLNMNCLILPISEGKLRHTSGWDKTLWNGKRICSRKTLSLPHYYRRACADCSIDIIRNQNKFIIVNGGRINRFSYTTVTFFFRCCSGIRITECKILVHETRLLHNCMYNDEKQTFGKFEWDLNVSSYAPDCVSSYLCPPWQYHSTSG
jgi:hypothetical protein